MDKILKSKKLYQDARKYFEQAEKSYDAPDLPLEMAFVYYYRAFLSRQQKNLKEQFLSNQIKKRWFLFVLI